MDQIGDRTDWNTDCENGINGVQNSKFTCYNIKSPVFVKVKPSLSNIVRGDL